MKSHAVSRVAVAASLAAIGVATTPAHADRVYHSEHLELAAVGGAPLRSGFVQNIKAEGPLVYAHEIFVLNGARPRATYTVTRNFFPFDSDCSGDNGVFASDVATLTTNRSGNARGDLFVRPEEVAGLEGVHGVKWTVQNAGGALVYRTACTAVTLD
ncbi:MAG: hypothetical protein ICV69_08560 [Thermoleophilaceae bacterium]|nr:hypothetical protein [Thermoleophilaceae bacterium]